jgi:hypothetical protein
MSLRNSCYSIVHDIPPVLMNVNGPEPMFRQGSIPDEHLRMGRKKTRRTGVSVRLDNFIYGHYSQPIPARENVAVPQVFVAQNGADERLLPGFANDPITYIRMAQRRSVSH